MRYSVLISVLFLASCSVTQQVTDGLFGSKGPEPTDVGPPPSEATSADTTVQTEPIAATPPAPAPAGALQTIAGLGDPSNPGLWLETPLVSQERQGVITWPVNGAQATVRLIPIGGESTAGSRLSLQGFQAIGAPVTDLIPLNVQPL